MLAVPRANGVHLPTGRVRQRARSHGAGWQRRLLRLLGLIWVWHRCPGHGGACDKLLHHMCAIDAGDESTSPRCFHCFLEAENDPPPPQSSEATSEAEGEEAEGEEAEGEEEDGAFGSQKHLVATVEEEREEPEGAATPDNMSVEQEGPSTPRTPLPLTPGRWDTESAPPLMRMSPAAPRSPTPRQPELLFGAGRGEMLAQPGDDECFYHCVRNLIDDDVDLREVDEMISFMGR